MRRYLSILGCLVLAFVIFGTPILGASNDNKKRDKKDPSPTKQAGADCRVDLSSVALPDVPEASGLAASRRTPGILWSHSDSGAPVLIALDARGQLKGKVQVRGATLADWEEVAVGSCGTSSCAYLADIGDNRGTRKGITIYRVPEPLPTDPATGSPEAFHGVFPDGPQDAEAFFVEGNGDMFIVTKGDTGPVALYRFPSPLSAGAKASTLQKLGVLQSGRVDRNQWITGASASLDGRWVVLRTHGRVAFYESSRILKGEFGSPLSFDLAGVKELQGEGIAFGAKGSVFLVGEGGGKGAAGTFGSLSCNLPG